MSKHIIAFGASNSSQSINKQLAIYAASQLEGWSSKILDLNDFEMPIYSMDIEKADGIPELAKDFKAILQECNGIIISFAEHNGAYSVAFKNVMDWTSRIDGDVWANKPMLLMATSPGGRGGATVLEIALNKFKFMTKGALQSFSLPSFFKNYSKEEGIKDEALAADFEEALAAFKSSVED